MDAAPLPIEAALPELRRALSSGSAAVLIAPPGAGKTTGVPQALLSEPWRSDGCILVVEPRRLAARAAAARVAALLGSEVGGIAGYRVRNETCVSAATRIEFVTAGVFLRLILADPELAGTAAVLFDEVHERSLDGDLGLALAIDAQAGLRPDLRLVAMSATVDGRRFARLLGDAPLIESGGRAYPVATRYFGSNTAARLEERVARAIRTALAEEDGSVLAFLPGQAEIGRTAARLEDQLPADVLLQPLYGTLPPREQDAAIRPAPAGRRKVVLATAIAETSLTIEGVRVVIDGGFARRPHYDPGSGLSRLMTVRISRAAADQRRGRAGRTAPGVCYRLWDEPQTASLPAFDRPEILDADLSGLALTLLAWGAADPAALRWLDPPPAAAWAEAQALLKRLEALDPAGGLNAHGRRLADLPLPPRLAHMVLAGAAAGEARLAAGIAAILSESGLGGRDIDLRHRLDALRRDRSERTVAARRAAERWARSAELDADATAAARDINAAGLLALAYPERLAQARGAPGRFRMANGSGAALDEADPLARERFLAIGEVTGGGPDARILLAAPIDRASIERLFAAQVYDTTTTTYDPVADRISGERAIRLDDLILSREPVAPDEVEASRAMSAAVLNRGFDAGPWPPEMRERRARIVWLRRADPSWPDLSDDVLKATGFGWLAPALRGRRRVADVTADDLRNAFAALLPWDRMAELDRLAPAAFTAPSGKAVPVDYASGEPVVRISVQNLFGLAAHPAVRCGAEPILFELLSPAGRPIQLTRDLPGFWRGSWRDVRAEMRGRYPKHAWPEDPGTALPQQGAKRRG